MRLATPLLVAGLVALSAAAAQNRRRHNLILFVRDGLHAVKVDHETAPAMTAVRDKGVNFRNRARCFPPSRWRTVWPWPPATTWAAAARSATPIPGAPVLTKPQSAHDDFDLTRFRRANGRRRNPSRYSQRKVAIRFA
jgi:hypothetical protein